MVTGLVARAWKPKTCVSRCQLIDSNWRLATENVCKSLIIKQPYPALVRPDGMSGWTANTVLQK